jgi:hypothetical protein
MPVTAVVPLQTHKPTLVLAASVAELVAVVAFVASASLAALTMLVVASLVLLAVGATNRHQMLALTRQGHVVLAATTRGRPRSVIGPAPHPLALPEPGGIGRRVELGGTTWWVDRSAFPFLRHARELLQADGEDDGGEGEDHSGYDRDAIQVAFDDRGSRRRRPEAPTEHLGEAAAASAVQEDEHDEGA